MAAEYIKAGGKEKYAEFKRDLLKEINALLRSEDIPETNELYELPCAFVNKEDRRGSGFLIEYETSIINRR